MIESPDARATAASLEEEGRFDEAAKQYVKSAATRIGVYIDDPAADNSNLGLAIPELMRALYCARRAENSGFAAALEDLFDGILALILEVSGNRDLETTQFELQGDVFLMLGSIDALDAYDEAMENYAQLDIGTQASIGLEPEIEESQHVVRDYLDWKDVELPKTTADDESTVVDLYGRTKLKRELAVSLHPNTSE